MRFLILRFSHNDLPYNLYELLNNNLDTFNFTRNLSDDALWGFNACRTCHTDLPRLRKGKMGAQVSEEPANTKERLPTEFSFLSYVQIHFETN